MLTMFWPLVSLESLGTAEGTRGAWSVPGISAADLGNCRLHQSALRQVPTRVP